MGKPKITRIVRITFDESGSDKLDFVCKSYGYPKDKPQKLLDHLLTKAYKKEKEKNEIGEKNN